MSNEHLHELLRIGAIVVFKTVVATTVGYYTRKFLVEQDRKSAAKKAAANAAN